MNMSQESDFVGKGLRDSFHQSARVNSGHDSDKTSRPADYERDPGVGSIQKNSPKRPFPRRDARITATFQ